MQALWALRLLGVAHQTHHFPENLNVQHCCCTNLKSSTASELMMNKHECKVMLFSCSHLKNKKAEYSTNNTDILKDILDFKISPCSKCCMFPSG
jgi:hypothetical protein